MIPISAKTANELFIKIARAIKIDGKISNPRGMKTLELNNVWLTLHNPTDSIVTLPSRKLNMDYLKGEMDWYHKGTYDVNEIAKHSKFWNKLSDKYGRVNSNYGMMLLREKQDGKSQLEWCIDRINEDKHTRQAVVNYNQPKHKFKDNKDFVCTIAQMFRVTSRNNINMLDATTIMRSNDLIRGLSYDLPWFTWVQHRLADEVNMIEGKYHHFAASLHVYERHWGMLEQIANERL